MLTVPKITQRIHMLEKRESNCSSNALRRTPKCYSCLVWQGAARLRSKTVESRRLRSGKGLHIGAVLNRRPFVSGISYGLLAYLPSSRDKVITFFIQRFEVQALPCN